MILLSDVYSSRSVFGDSITILFIKRFLLVYLEFNCKCLLYY